MIALAGPAPREMQPLPTVAADPVRDSVRDPEERGSSFREGRPATRPPEARGIERDGVRLLVAGEDDIEHAQFRDLPRFLEPGDLLVVNDSATLPAAVDGERRGGRRVTVHISTDLGDGAWAVEVRPPGRTSGPVGDLAPGERITLPAGAEAVVAGPYRASASAPARLWRATIAGGEFLEILRRHGRPIRYAYVEGRWPVSAYQTVFARHPGSAEMPSAARPFTGRLVRELVARGVKLVPITLHTGVSSLEPGEPPYPERFRVSRGTADQMNRTRAGGHRVVAVGTTAARAIESVASSSGRLEAREGWTDLVLGPDRRARATSGIVTGWHAGGGSHLRLLEAVAGPELVERAYREARASGYLWHEFGDSCLLLSEG